MNQRMRELKRGIDARELLTKPVVAAELEETILDRQEEIHERLDEHVRVILRSPEFERLVRDVVLNTLRAFITTIIAKPAVRERLEAALNAEIEKLFEPLVAATARAALEERLKKLLADLRVGVAR